MSSVTWPSSATCASKSTLTTNKANFALARRRERRRGRQSIEGQSSGASEVTKTEGCQEKETVESIVSSSSEVQSSLPINRNSISSSPSTPPVTPPRRYDQEKAYNYLAQRRARRRQNRPPMMMVPDSPETNQTLETADSTTEDEQSNSLIVEDQNPLDLSSNTMTTMATTTSTDEVPEKNNNNNLRPDQCKRLIVLLSRGVSDRVQASNQSRALTLLQARGTPYIAVDGMDPAQRERRNELFAISGIRANYPQFFLEDREGTTTFVGNWDTLEQINDSSSLPEETLEAYPTIQTWDRTFGTLVQSFD